MTDFDTDGGNYKPKNKSISFMESFLDEFDLIDVWRVMNPNTQKFTWRTYSPLVQRRVDYYFLSCPLQSAVTIVVFTPHVPMYFWLNRHNFKDIKLKFCILL